MTKMMIGGTRSGRLRMRFSQLVSILAPPHLGRMMQPMTTVTMNSPARTNPGVNPAR